MPKSTLTLDSIDLTIDSLSYNGGRGVGRYEGVVVFVPGTAPGDKVRARVTVRKPRFWEAELVEILKPSEDRRVAPCPVADRCGGCSWQHVTYAAQLKQKQKILADSLRPLTKVAEWEWLAFVPAPDEFHYRNRIQIQIRGGKKGFFSKRSNDLVEIAECLIAERQLNEKFRDYQPSPDERRVELRVDASDHNAFAQVNHAQNEILKKLVVDAVKGRPDWILDLYAGGGNFTLPLAAAFPEAKIIGVEMSREAVESARKSEPRIEWHQGDVGLVLAKLPIPKGTGVIVLDPPRTGCAPNALEQIQRFSPAQIVYVSCNPTTFARDAVKLAASYKVRTIQGLDMFPQTEHVELLGTFNAAQLSVASQA